MLRLEPETCDCGKKMEMASITYAGGKPEKVAWKCPACRTIKKQVIRQEGNEHGSH